MPRRERGNSGRLLLGSRKAATVEKYLKEVGAFLEWTREWEEMAASPEELDEVLVDYFHELLEQGYGPHKAVCCYYGLVMLSPRMKNALPISKQALTGYKDLFPSVAYPPLRRQLVHLVAVDLHQRGLRSAALAVLLAFESLLRIGEVVSLHVTDFADSKDDRLPLGVRFTDGFRFRLRSTKTGDNQWSRVRDPVVVRLLRDRVAKFSRRRQKDPKARLFSFDAAQLRKWFKQSLVRVGLGDTYVFHSLRHGRATELYLLETPLEDVLVEGRWASTKTARHYVQTGRALLIATLVPEAVAQKANQVSLLLPFLL